MDEQELIRRAGQGDEDAFEQLVNAYEKPVYNLCLRMCGDRDEDKPLERQIADYSTDPAVLAEKAQDHEAVREAMNRLPDQDRLILSMRAIEDMSYQEIGDALQLQPGTVKSRISRAREKIRRSLDGNFFEGSSSRKGKGGMRS